MKESFPPRFPRAPKQLQ